MEVAHLIWKSVANAVPGPGTPLRIAAKPIRGPYGRPEGPGGILAYIKTKAGPLGPTLTISKLHIAADKIPEFAANRFADYRHRKWTALFPNPSP